MAKTSSYHLKSTPKLVVPPPSERLKLFPPPPLFIGVKLHVPPPSRFVAPPPLPVISDHSLSVTMLLFQIICWYVRSALRYY